MTKVQIRFRLRKPLDDAMLSRIADAHAVYGIYSIRIDPSLDGLTVEYDATRFGPDDVEGTLGARGIPVMVAA
jgi:hypothetical protein